MDYIASAINQAGYSVDIISPSWMGDNTNVGYEKQKKIIINENTSVIMCPSWKTTNKFSRNFKIIFSLVWLFLYLVFNVKKGEKILAYHVEWISLPIRAAKFIKKFKLILEVEEIYSEVWKKSKKFQKLEEKLIDSADSYIFVSDTLRDRFKSSNKKSIVLYGSYYVLNQINKPKKETNTIRLIYAGSVDLTKGGAFKAVETMKYLPDYYTLHILGHGSFGNINKLNELINNVNKENNKEKCIYIGILNGQAYSDFLFDCDIALNPQDQGEYMNTAFPSKIISYLSHNLRIVSTDILSVRNSVVSKYITFSKNDNPKSIKEAILKVDLKDPFDSSSLISKLDNEFVRNIKEMLKQNNV